MKEFVKIEVLSLLMVLILPIFDYSIYLGLGWHWVLTIIIACIILLILNKLDISRLNINTDLVKSIAVIDPMSFDMFSFCIAVLHCLIMTAGSLYMIDHNILKEFLSSIRPIIYAVLTIGVYFVNYFTFYEKIQDIAFENNYKRW